MDKKQLYDFAVKWIKKFEDPNISPNELLDHYLADECEALGFEMDCGQAFCAKYGDAAANSRVLKNIIQEVDDITLLGSAIYSRWRYFNHWAYSDEELLLQKNRDWFILAFERMKQMSK